MSRVSAGDSLFCIDPFYNYVKEVKTLTSEFVVSELDIEDNTEYRKRFTVVRLKVPPTAGYSETSYNDNDGYVVLAEVNVDVFEKENDAVKTLLELLDLKKETLEAEMVETSSAIKDAKRLLK